MSIFALVDIVVDVKLEPLSLEVTQGNDYTLHCSYTYYYHGDFETKWVTVKWYRNTDPASQRADAWCSNSRERVLLLTANNHGNGKNTDSSSLTILSGSDASLPAINNTHSLTIHSLDAHDEGAYVCAVEVHSKTGFELTNPIKYSPAAEIRLAGEYM